MNRQGMQHPITTILNQFNGFSDIFPVYLTGLVQQAKEIVSVSVQRRWKTFCSDD